MNDNLQGVDVRVMVTQFKPWISTFTGPARTF